MMNVKKAIGNATESLEFKLSPTCYLALYGNEDKTESYLLSIYEVNEEENVYDSIKLNDYYTSIEQNPNNHY